MNRLLIIPFILPFILGFTVSAIGQELSPSTPPSRPQGMVLDLPMLDLPFNASHGGSFPSMAQSLGLSAGFYQAMHYGIGVWLDPLPGSTRTSYPLAAKLVTMAMDFLTITLPLGDAWLHEEWHRAVLSRHGIGSYNGVYDFDVFSSTISVSHVLDEDLSRLKATSPADQVRLSTAGLEGDIQLEITTGRNGFFYNPRTWDPALLWFLKLNYVGYMKACATKDSDRVTAELEAREGDSIAKRDFTGMDCNGWTYDLFHPDEPYAARGIHPSGLGIDRYRVYSEQSPAEQRYLRQQMWLSLLNFADPNLLGLRRFFMRSPFNGRPLSFNLALRHLPTAFGYDIRLDLLVRQDWWNLAVTAHAYINHQVALPGLEVEWLRYPVGRLLLSSRLSLWLQPKAQRFDTSEAQAGALASLRATWGQWRGFRPYLEIEGKSAGWVMGNVYLDRQLSSRLGVSADLF